MDGLPYISFRQKLMPDWGRQGLAILPVRLCRW